MPTSATWARAATGLVAALLTSVPATALAAPSDAASADPALAVATDVAADLERLDRAVDDARADVVDAHAVLIDAEDHLDEATADAARRRRAAEALEEAQSLEVEPPTTDVFEMLGGSVAHGAAPERATQADPDPVDEARAAVAAAEDASEDAVESRDAAQAELATYLDGVVARTTDRLAQADQLALSGDPASADVMRVDESVLFPSLAAAVAHEQARAAEDAAAATGTDGAPTAGTPTDPGAAPTPEPAPLPDPTGSASGAVAGAWCADGTRIVVDASLGLSVQYLVNDAAAAGVGICGSGFRTYWEQVELRRQNCGPSDAAVYHAAPSSCSPPTARPGTSNHEDGLAIDFSCADGQPMTHASPCYQWLAANAGWYGLRNLPSEPWHWSVSGT